MDTAKQYDLMCEIYKLLQNKTDADHTLSTPEIQAELNAIEMKADRRTIYRSLEGLKKCGFDIRVKKEKKTGYYMVHLLTCAEALILIDAVQSSNAFSKKESKKLIQKICSLLSEEDRKNLPETIATSTKTKNDLVLKTIEKLIPAISQCHPVEFLYYDLSVTREKQYRHSKKTYHLIPYAIASENGRYYCVFYSEKYSSFSNYRLDKMERVKVLEEEAQPVPFSLETHLKESMLMYHGAPQTVTARFDISMASPLFDQFGDNIIISKVEEDFFTASIKTTLSPTLTSWFLMFYDRTEILKPQELKDEMRAIAAHLTDIYKED